MNEARPQQFVAVLDFGAQYGQLIARRVRDLHVYSEIVPCDISADELIAMKPSALILSGGPASVYAEDAPHIDPNVLALGVPVFGFCYGHQIIAATLGGVVGHTEKGEYGPARLSLNEAGSRSKIFDRTPDPSRCGFVCARGLYRNRFHRRLSRGSHGGSCTPAVYYAISS